jgi:hypothetical protein
MEALSHGINGADGRQTRPWTQRVIGGKDILFYSAVSALLYPLLTRETSNPLVDNCSLFATKVTSI